MKNNKSKSFLSLFYLLSFIFIICPLFSFFARNYLKSIKNLDLDMLFSALSVSFSCSIISIIVVVLVGIPSGYFMARYDFKGKQYIDMLFNIPMVLPPAVIGLVLLMTFGRNGFIGKYLHLLGIPVTFSKTAVIIAITFVSLPIFINGVSEGFKKVDNSLIITAMTLGDSPLQAFRRVTFPLSKSAIYTSAIMAWARGLAEFGATMMFAGNIKGVTQTLPLAIYTAMENNIETAMVISFIMIVISVSILIFTHVISKKLM